MSSIVGHTCLSYRLLAWLSLILEKKVAKARERDCGAARTELYSESRPNDFKVGQYFMQPKEIVNMYSMATYLAKSDTYL